MGQRCADRGSLLYSISFLHLALDETMERNSCIRRALDAGFLMDRYLLARDASCAARCCDIYNV